MIRDNITSDAYRLEILLYTFAVAFTVLFVKIIPHETSQSDWAKGTTKYWDAHPVWANCGGGGDSGDRGVYLTAKFYRTAAGRCGEKTVLFLLPGVVLAVTILAVLSLLFFGVRGYIMGTRIWQPIQRGRMKIKR